MPANQRNVDHQAHSHTTTSRRDAGRADRHQARPAEDLLPDQALTPLERAASALNVSTQYYIHLMLQSINDAHSTTTFLKLSVQPDSVEEWYRDGDVDPTDVKRIILGHANRTPAEVTMSRTADGRLVTLIQYE
jgi:hypothetical protein